jgi:endoglucanase
MVRSRRPLAAILAASATAAVLVATGGPSTTIAAGQTATRPSVQVVGDRLVDAAGRPIRLLGVNRAGTQDACIQGWGFFDGPSDDASIAAMAAWHINAVRVPINEDCWLGINGVDPALSGPAYQRAIIAYVNRLHAHGLLVVLSLFTVAPGAQPSTDGLPMVDYDHGPTLWYWVARAFRYDPGVLFDLYNEPHDIGWSCWRNSCFQGGVHYAGMQTLVWAVRVAGAPQPIMLGGIGWAGDPSGWWAFQPYDPVHQLVVSEHSYDFSPCATACMTTLQQLSTAVPVVTGEIGDSDCAHGYIDQYMRWADLHGISYLAWTWNAGWDCRTGPSLITDWAGTPTGYGVGYRSHLAALAGH